MTLAHRDRTDILELIHLNGHFVDSGELERLGELCPPEVTYDVRSARVRSR